MADTKSVFISYSSKDAGFVNQITKVLKDMRISYWKAPEMIPAGSSYAREIPRAIRECEVFLLVLSKASQTSIWVEKEIDSAINHRKTIVPVKIDEVPLCETYRFYLNNVQTISYKEDLMHNFIGIKEEMKKLLQLNQEEEDLFEDVEDYSITKQKNLERQNESSKEADKRDTSNCRMILNDTSRSRSGRKADVFRINKVPLECKYCGGELEETGVGIFRCTKCGEENYDYLRTVRNFLEKEGAKPATVIAKETGVPRNVVDHFLRQEFLEIPKLAPERLSCQQCGAPIRTGYLCDKCKSPRQGIVDKSMRGRWYTGKSL